MKNKEFIEKQFENKKKFHKAAANEPFEEKIKKIIELQKIYVEMKKATNRELKPHEVPWDIKFDE